MTTVITRMFESYSDASQAVTELESAGIAHGDISIVASNNETSSNAAAPVAYTDDNVATDPDAPATGAGAGASVGTLVGGGAGLLAGIGMLAIPGVGPVIAAGWLVATLTGAGVGAGFGGLLGGLVGAGVPEEHAHVYAEGVRRGGTLVTVRAPEGQSAQAEAVLAKYATIDPATRGDEYRQTGWSKFDETAPAYVAEPNRAGLAADPLTGTRTPIV